ncbi:MAG: Hpt domain-containing protein [Spirochaetaceae bacterium]|nr:Hpt domain-containing protein [Spirochaetaceae bacterium]MDD6486028.1 Hpt domain-containing protein [Spirochaetales bacterium]
MEKQILNLENGLEMMGGDKELYRELIEEFIKTDGIDLEELTKLTNAHDYTTAATKVHRVKGSSATIGGERLQEICAQAEAIFRGKVEGDPLPLLPEIDKRYKEFIAELKKALEKL